MVWLSVMGMMADNWKNLVVEDTEGTEFYVTYMHANTQAGVLNTDISLFMAARQRAFVTIMDSLSNIVIDTFTIQATSLANSSHSWRASQCTVPNFSSSTYYCTSSDHIYNASIKVVSSTPISLYLSNAAATSSDASLVLPTNRLGREYVIQSPSKNAEVPEFAIVAAHNNTVVTINPTAPITTGSVPKPAGVPYQVTLNQGQVYFASGASYESELSGTSICATEDVMVINGSQSMYSPSDVQSHVCHVSTPLHQWGKEFVLTMMAPQNSNEFKIVAADSTTVVKIHDLSGTYQYTVAPFDTIGYYWDSDIAGSAIYVEADMPVVCFQYMHAKADQVRMTGRQAGGLPSATLVAPLEQCVPSAMFTTFEDSIHTLTYYVNIVCPTASTATMMLDHSTVPAASFQPVPGNPSYSFANCTVGTGAHLLENSGGDFTATAYALSAYSARNQWSYAHTVGMNCQHQDAYMKIDGERTNKAIKCRDENDQWVWDFTAEMNMKYDSIAWYYDRGRMGEGDSIRYTFNLQDSLLRNIYMYVYRYTPICDSVVIDTVESSVYNAVPYNTRLPIAYYCKGDTITAFPGTEIEYKIYTDTLRTYYTYEEDGQFVSKEGCDSTVHFKYEILDPQDSTLTIHICQDTVFTYKGVDYNTTGVYVFDEMEHGKCPYQKTINLIVDSVYDIHTRQVICDQELPYIWVHGDGTADTLMQSQPDLVKYYKTAAGCDSIHHLHLTVGSTYQFDYYASICDVEAPYTWHGQDYSATGTYQDRHNTSLGCDSVFILHLTVNPTYHFIDSVAICGSTSYMWRGRDYTKSGVYFDSLKTAAGCDSVFQLWLHVDSVYYYPTVAAVCLGQTYTWRGRNIPTDLAGTRHYYDSLVAVNGCDSIYDLIMTVNPVYEIEVLREICQGDSYEFAGQTRTQHSNQPGSYSDTAYFKTAAGCDSVMTLQLTVHPTYYFEAEGTACPDEPYRWQHGALDTTVNSGQPGVHDYYVSRATAHGCDSIYHLTLTVSAIDTVTRFVTMSDQDSIVWDGKSYGGTKYNKSAVDSVLQSSPVPDTIEHRYTSLRTGCDSLMRLIVIVGETYEQEERVTTCQYEEYPIEGHASWTWANERVGENDTIYIYKTALGYDSIRHLYVTVLPTYHFTDTAYTCCNEDYHWEGRKHVGYLGVGTYTLYDSLMTADGCDSVYERILIVQDTVLVAATHVICDNQAFVWDGTVFAGDKYAGVADSVLSAGEYSYRRTYVSTVTGCDSFMTLVLTVNPTYEFYDTATTCQYDTYTVNAEDLMQWTLHKDTAGVYDDTFIYQTIDGCDSVRHLHLTVYPEYTFDEDASTCCNTEFVWEGHRDIGILPVGRYVFYDSIKTAEGCDSVHVLHLTVNDTSLNATTHVMCDVDSYLWDKIVIAGEKFAGAADTVLTPGVHHFRNTYASLQTGCDSTMTLVLTVNPTYEFHDTATTCQYDTYIVNAEDTRQWTLHKDTAGVYDDTFTYQTINGCDSVRHLHLTVYPEYYFHETDTACNNYAYQWTGHAKSIPMLSAGIYTYYDSLMTKDGCDSVYELTLTVFDTIANTTVQSICDNGMLLWDGRIYAGDKYQGTADVVVSAAGTAYEFVNTYTSERTGCDSVERLLLTVNQTYLTVLDKDSVCQGQSYKFCTKVLDCSQPGTFTYYDTLQTSAGCDSVIKIVLTVNPTYEFVTTDTICDNTEWTWRAHVFSNVPAGDTTVTDHYLTREGCDSVYVLHLTSMPSYLFEDTIEMCDYDTVVWRGVRYYGLETTEHIYLDSLVTGHGCDSVYRLLLKVHPHYYSHDTLTMCDNETIVLRGHTLRYTEGEYTVIDTLSTVHGCDSILETSIVVHPTYFFSENRVMCAGDSVWWRGSYYRYNSGIYYDSLKTADGCDSVYQLIVNAIPGYLYDYTATICSNEVYTFQGKDLNTTGDHYFKYVSKEGCDSQYVLHLTVLPAYDSVVYDTICSNENYHFGGGIVNKPGVYYDSVRTLFGCDSVTVLHLAVNQAYHFVTADSSHCDGDSVYFRGRYYAHPGVYYDSLMTKDGCDSVYEFRLTMKPTYLFETDTVVCDFMPLTWRGKQYGASGTYYDSLLTKAGCDSVYALYLQMVPTEYVTLDTTVCQGESVMFGGMQCSVTGTYYDTVSFAYSDECRVTRLDLTAVPPTLFQKISDPEICADDSMLIVPHRLFGAPAVKYSVLFDAAAKAQGFEDVIDEPYDGVIEAPVPESVREEWYAHPDSYQITVRVNNGVCNPETYEYHGSMMVKYPSWVIEQKWGDVVAALNEFFNGGYKISDYEWVVNGSTVQQGDLSYIYLPGRLALGDIVYAKLTREGENYSIETCPIVIEDRSAKQTSDFHVLVTGDPNPHGALHHIRVNADTDGKFFIMDITGKRLMNGEAMADIPLDIEMPYPAGVYVLYFHTDSGMYRTVKFVLQ